MGWQVEEWRVAVRLDAHGGDKERAHDALWKQMWADLERVKNDPKYADLNPM
jgi:hypothetical protein